MYLTRVKLDILKRETQLALSASGRFHGAVEQAFEQKQNRNLWRIDKLRGEYYILILSEEVPNLKDFMEQFGDSKSSAETKEYEVLLNKITDHSVWRFRMVANPTHSVKTKSGRGKVMAHVTPEHQMEWLKTKAAANGFELVDDNCLVLANEWKNFYKNTGGKDMRVRLMLVSFEGILRVTDVHAFRNALISGIGRGKAYGAGMLTISRT